MEKEFEKRLLTKKSDIVKLKSKTTSFVVNHDRKGFYRVQYENSLLDDLKKLVKEKKTSHINRWAIQNDLFALGIQGKSSVKNYLDFSSSYYDEKNYLAAINVASNLNFLYNHTFFESFSDEIRNFSVQYFSNVLKRLRWESRPSEKTH